MSQIPPFEPTVEEIAEGCRAIQAEWSPQEERSRRVVQNPLVETAVVRETVPTSRDFYAA